MIPSSQHHFHSLMMYLLLSLFAAAVAAALLSTLRRTQLNLPPGPFALPIFGNWLQLGSNLDYHGLTKLSKKFGQLFLLKMGHCRIAVVSSAELAKEVLITQGREFGSRPGTIVSDVFSGKGQDMIFAEYGDHWRKMRRIMIQPFFTNRAVQQYHGDWEAEAAAVVEDVRRNPEAATKGVVLSRRLELMVYNNVYKMMFNRRFESENDALYLELQSVNGERSRLAQSREYNFGDFMPIFRPFFRGYLERCMEVARKRFGLYKSFITERKKQRSTESRENNGLKCGIDHFVEAQKNGEINEDNALYLIENMNVAGTMTTLWGLEWAIAELVNNPKIQMKLRAEIDVILGPGQVTKPNIEKLPYLQAVIKETLRFRMLAPCLSPRITLHPTKLGGYDIPSQTRVYVNAWRLANDPARWKKPEEFRPERFLEEESEVEVNGNDIKYLPFGLGRRNCPGIPMAMAVIGITLGRLVQNFELQLPPGQSEIDTSENNGQFFTRMLNQFTVVMKPRYV